jgi:hypothetical protein
MYSLVEMKFSGGTTRQILHRETRDLDFKILIIFKGDPKRDPKRIVRAVIAQSV